MTEKEAEKAYDAAPTVPLPAARVTAIVKAATADDGRPKRALCSKCGERARVQGLKTCGTCTDLSPPAKPGPEARICKRCNNRPATDAFDYCAPCRVIVYSAD